MNHGDRAAAADEISASPARPHRTPEEVVAWQGAVQAQGIAAARWGLALRMTKRTTDEEIERAVNEGRILRTHVMRPTWHFVTPADIRWMLETHGTARAPEHGDHSCQEYRPRRDHGVTRHRDLRARAGRRSHI